MISLIIIGAILVMVVGLTAKFIFGGYVQFRVFLYSILVLDH